MMLHGLNAPHVRGSMASVSVRLGNYTDHTLQLDTCDDCSHLLTPPPTLSGRAVSPRMSVVHTLSIAIVEPLCCGGRKNAAAAAPQRKVSVAVSCMSVGPRSIVGVGRLHTYRHGYIYIYGRQHVRLSRDVERIFSLAE
jgi:hypothetical protein